MNNKIVGANYHFNKSDKKMYSIQFYNKPKNTNNYSYDMGKIQFYVRLT